MKKKIVILAANMLLFLMSGIFFLQPGVAKAENDPEDLGGYMTAAENGCSVIFNLIDSDNKIAESYNIRAVAAESGVPGTDPHMSVKFNVSSTARTNSSHFNFSVVPGTYGTKLDQHGMYTILDLTCTMKVPPYLRQAGIGDNSIPSVFKEDKTDGYQTYIDNYPYGRFGAYSYDPRGCVGFASFQLPRTPDGAERGSYTFKLQINIGNFRMNERTVGNVVAKKTYQFRYNKVAFLFNVANASVGSGHGFSSQNGYLNFDLLGGGQLLVVPFNGNPATFEPAAGYDVHKPGYRFHCWESTVNNAAYGGGQSFNAHTPYILELFRDHANPAGCSVVNVDDSNPGQAWTGMNPNLTILQELKPVWDLIGYKITYNLQGGTNPNNPDGYTVETPDFTLKNPTRAGYEFTGWTGSNGGTESTNVTVKKGTTGDLTFTAHWNRLLAFYKLTFDLNGGTIDDSAKTKNTPLVNKIEEGKKWNTVENISNHITITSKFITKIGYEFTGWYFADGTKFTGEELATADTTVHAEWKPIEYPITYHLKNGTDPHNPDKYTIETPDFTLKNPEKAGYEFTGWTGSNGETPETEVTVKQGSTGDKKFTANWKPAAYQITYDLDGGSDPKNPDKYTIETPTFTLKNPKRKGYLFKGWTGTGLKDRTKKVTVKKGSTGDRHYKANWEPKMSKLPYLKTSKLINKGSSFRFLVYGEKKKGYRRIWKNSNKKVISLSNKGVAKAKKNGTAVVGYKLYDKKDRLVYGFQIKVRVITTDFQTLNTSKKISVQNPTFMFDKTLCIGKKFKLGFRNLEKGAKVTYRSSNPKILSVSKKGVATSKKKGFAYVTITLKQQHLTYRYRVHFKCEKIEF